MQSNCEITGPIYVIKYKERDDPNAKDLMMGLGHQGDQCITFADHAAIVQANNVGLRTPKVASGIVTWDNIQPDVELQTLQKKGNPILLMDKVYSFASLLVRAYEENILTDQSCYDLMMNKMSASTQPKDTTFQQQAPHSSSGQIPPVLSQGAQQLIGFDKFHAPMNSTGHDDSGFVSSPTEPRQSLPHQISAGPGSGTDAVADFANNVNIANEENELNSLYAKLIASNEVGGNWQQLYVKAIALLDKTKQKLSASQSECLEYMMAADRETQKVKSYRAADASELMDCLKPTLQPALSASTSFTMKLEESTSTIITKLSDLIARFEKLEETVVNNTGDLKAVRNILVNNGLDVHKFDVVGALSDIQFRLGQPVQVVEMTDVQPQENDSMPPPTTWVDDNVDKMRNPSVTCASSQPPTTSQQSAVETPTSQGSAVDLTFNPHVGSVTTTVAAITTSARSVARGNEQHFPTDSLPPHGMPPPSLTHEMPPPSLTHEMPPPSLTHGMPLHLSSYQSPIPSVCSQPNQTAVVPPRSTTAGLFYNTPLPYPPSGQLLNQVPLMTTSGPPPQFLQGPPPQFHGGQRFTFNPVHRPPFPVQLAPTLQSTPVPNSNLFGLASAQQVARPAHTVGGRTPTQFLEQFPRMRAMLNNPSGPNWPNVTGPPSKMGRY